MAITVAVAPVAGAGAAVYIRATALSGMIVPPSAAADGTRALHAAANGAEVELAAVFSAVPSSTALSCLSRMVAVRAQLAALTCRRE